MRYNYTQSFSTKNISNYIFVYKTTFLLSTEGHCEPRKRLGWQNRVSTKYCKGVLNIIAREMLIRFGRKGIFWRFKGGSKQMLIV